MERGVPLAYTKQWSKGKKILKIYEVWHFPENQRKEGLFGKYVNKWLKNKTRSNRMAKRLCNSGTESSIRYRVLQP